MIGTFKATKTKGRHYEHVSESCLCVSLAIVVCCDVDGHSALAACNMADLITHVMTTIVHLISRIGRR